MTARPGAALAAAAAALAFAAPADAAVDCRFTGPSGSPGAVVIVELDAPGDAATVAAEGGEIRVNGTPCLTAPLLGEPATVRNTDVVYVGDSSPGPTDVRIADPASFAPGLTNEGDGSAEIELFVAMDAGPGDVLRLEAAGADAQDRYELGTVAGALAGNLNARTEDADSEDADLATGGVDHIVGDGRALDDKVDGDAGSPFAGPIATPLEAFGADGEDTLRGGAAADLLHGGAGDDVLDGGDGRDVLLGEGEEDVLTGGDGPDRLDGGDDDDIVDYRPVEARRGLTADLGGGRVGGAGGGDRLVAVEGIFGTAGPDRVEGSGALNFVYGGGGRDELTGGAASDALLGAGGADSLSSGGGRDVVFAAGGGRDRVDCGPGRDAFEADGTDRVRACEARIDRRGARAAIGHRVRTCVPAWSSFSRYLPPC